MKKLLKKSFSLFLAAILVINGLMVLNPLITKAAVSLPKVAVVSLDHYPFVEGDSNKFFISSKDFSGKVQYQLFYTCKRTMGTRWELITTGDMTNGWTKAVDAHEPITVDISSLDLKADYYRFAIRVRRVGYKGTYSNQYGDYDYAYPFSVKVVDNANINLNGDMKINKEVFVQGDSLKIDGINGEDSSTQYKLHLYDVKNSRWLINLTDYDSSINYTLNNLPAGKYIVDVWGKKENSTSSYDGYKLKTIEVKEEALPKVAIVSLDHTPFKEGDQNKFFISSKEYDGQVQYQLFYTCKATMGTNWELINTDDMVEGWTKPVDAHEPITVDISHLNLKAEYYRFAIRVRRVGFKGRYSNKYGDYDNAYPFTEYVVKSPKIELNGEMLIDKTEYAKNDQLVINGVNNAGTDTKYKLHLYDVKNNKWITNLTDYEDKIDYDLSNIPEGTYVIDMWCKKNGSSSKYDGWKLKVINVTSDILKIASVEDMEAETWKNSNCKLPEKALAVMEDGSTHYKGVKWDGQVDTSKEGVYTFEGTVLGYDKKVKLVLNIKNGRGNTPGNIINTGLVTSSDGWIYYCNPSDDGKLYKTNIDDERIVKVSDDSALYINVVDDWVYYCNYSANGDGAIYKIKTDGTQRIKLNNDISEHVTVENGWIYYANASDEYKLYKVKTDGISRTKLNNDFSLNVNLAGGYIYYTNMSDNNRVYRIKTDGTGRTKLNNDESAFINVADGWIYYANKSDDYKIYKMKTDGTGRVKISDESAAFINVYDGWIYYSNLGRDTRLYKIKTDGTSNTRLNYGVTMLIQVVGDYVYYINDSGDDKLYRVKNDGSEFETFGIDILEIQDTNITIIKNNMYTLPSTVKVKMVDGSFKDMNVTWEVDKIDTSKIGEYTYEGTVKATNKKALLKVKILEVVSVYYETTGKIISKGYTGFAAIPTSWTNAILNDGSKRVLTIHWNFDSIPRIPGEYTYEGTVIGYDKKLSFNLTVVETDNIPTGEIQAQDGAWIYYKNINDKELIYRIRKDGTGKMKVIDEHTPSIIISDGWIYYDRYGMNKIKCDGTEKTKISDVSANIICSIGEWIYYKNINDRMCLYRIKTDGSENTKLTEYSTETSKIIRDFIYYVDSNTNSLYKMKVDGSEKTKMIDNVSNTIDVVDDWIYYVDNEAKNLMKIKIDSTEKITLMEDEVRYISCIVDGWIYFKTTEGGILNKIKIDGTNHTVISNKGCFFVYVIDNWVYYLDINYNIWKVKTDGTNNTLLTRGALRIVNIVDGWIYYKTSPYNGEGLSKIKIDGTQNQIIG